MSFFEIFCICVENAAISIYYYFINYWWYVLILFLLLITAILEFREKQFLYVDDERKVI